MGVFHKTVISLFLLCSLFLLGCCSYFVPGARPHVSLNVTPAEGPAPLPLKFSYTCYDPADQLQSCELRMDGRAFANGTSVKNLTPKGFEYPDFYYEALRTPGEHTLQIAGFTTDGQMAMANATFTVLVPPNRPPDVFIRVNKKSGHPRFVPPYTYHCFDPDDNMVSCGLKMDGVTYTQAANQSGLFPPDYVQPPSFWSAGDKPGNHTIEIFAVDSEGLNASMNDTFTVLDYLPLTEPGWYDCTNRSEPPCDDYRGVYCDKFVPTDLTVREAASAAIASHPGPYSVNQLLDIYDYVHEHVPYQNVPVNLTYQPYPPSQTLATKSGDCKNQAVLIASMVEAIGGTARVLLIPGCNHAFAEVYIGNVSALEAFNDAVFSHYKYSPVVNWHNSSGEIWFIMDTAGGQYPGQTIPKCLNKSDAPQTFVIDDCNRPPLFNPPAIGDIEYGPFILYDKNMVIDPGYWQYFSYTKDSRYRLCRYNVDFQSLSNQPFSEYVIPASDYESFRNQQSYRAYDRQEQVMHAQTHVNVGDPYEFRVIAYNKGSSSITVHATINSTCYN